jgi:hypothetical protein
MVEWGAVFVLTQRLAVLTCAAFAFSCLAKMPDISKNYATTASYPVRFFTAVNKSTPGHPMLHNVQPIVHTRSLK